MTPAAARIYVCQTICCLYISERVFRLLQQFFNVLRMTHVSIFVFDASTD